MMVAITRRAALAGAMAAPLVASAATQQAGSGPFAGTFPTTYHHGRFNGVRIAYIAKIERIPVQGTRSIASAEIVTFSYERVDLTERSDRPVIFVFGGGPGASSYLHHLYFMGPKRLTWPDGTGRGVMIDNQHALLDVADIVFVDPAGTGFSRVFPGGADDMYSVAGDARAFIQVADEWCRRRGRSNSPVYLEGSSYGSVRAIRVGWELRRTRPLAGVFVTANSAMVQETLRPNSVLGPAVDLPTRALTAVYHGLVARDGRTDAAIIDEAYAFGLSAYVAAIARRRELSAVHREDVARRLEALTSIPAHAFLDRGLIIDWADYAKLLLEGRGLVLNDIQNGRSAARPDVAPSRDREASAFEDYLRGALRGSFTSSAYIASNEDLGKLWDFRGPDGAAANDWPAMLVEQMRDAPDMIYWSANGFYDHLSTLGQARYLFSRSDLPVDRAYFRALPGGHLIYKDPDTARIMLDDIRGLIGGRVSRAKERRTA